MTRKYRYKCSECGQEQVVRDRSGVRILKACHECGDVTSWERQGKAEVSTDEETSCSRCGRTIDPKFEFCEECRRVVDQREADRGKV